jgi:hypothetical protein
MKKSNILIGLLALTVTTAKAQITITQADFPSILTTKIVLTDSTDGLSGITPGLSGSNQVWDFSNYTMGNTQTVTFDYSQNITHPEFTNANISTCNNNGAFELCAFYEINSSGLYHIGSVFEVVMPQPAFMRGIVRYTPQVPEYEFPLTYNTNYSSNFLQTQLNTSNPPQNGNDSVLIHSHRTRLVEVDGWGTLITPLGTNNVLRLKITETEIDTQWVHTPGVGWSVNYAHTLSGPFVSYEWVSNVSRIIVARLRQGQNPGTWRFSFIHDGTNVPQVPAAPSNLTATTNKRSNGSIELNWQDNANNEDGFYVEFSQDTTGSSWTLLATLGVDEETYIHTGLNDGEQFFYRVSAFNAVGSSAFSNVAETTLSVNSFHDFFENNISIYPNPVKNQLFISANQNNANLLAEIFDLTGKRIKEVNIINNLEKIDVSEFDNGMYYLKINTNEGVKVLKFIKN